MASSHSSSSLFLLFLPMFSMLLLLCMLTKATGTSINGTTLPPASPRVIRFPMYHIQKFHRLNTHEEHESFMSWRLAQDEIRMKHWASITNARIDGPENVTVPLGVAPTGEYLVEIRIGSNRMKTHLLLDTGSDLVWWQCKPCTECYEQLRDPLYDTELSSSFDPIGCDSNDCDFENYHFLDRCSFDYYQEDVQECFYKFSYADDTSTTGQLAYEKVSNKDMFIKRIIFGCGREQKGKHFFGYYAGILGFGQGRYSFPTQLGASKFSFCIFTDPDRTDQYLYLHDFPAINGGVTVEMVTNHRRHIHAYYVKLKAISIFGSHVPIKPDKWNIDSNGSYGVILDTGTRITRFPREVYSIFRESYEEAVFAYQPLEETRNSFLDTCYHVPSDNLGGDFPPVSLHFGDGDGRRLLLKPDAVMIKMATEFYCLAFAPSDEKLTIIGSHQLQDTRLSFDTSKMTLTFSPEACLLMVS